MIKRFTLREKIIALITFLVLFGFVGYQYGYTPITEDIEQSKSSVTSLRKQIRKSLKTVKQAEALQEIYEPYIAVHTQTNSDEQVMASILAEIEKVAQDLQLAISDLKPQKVRSEDQINRFSVSVTMNSDLNSIMEFLHMLQDEPHMLTVESFSFDKGSRRQAATLKSRLVLSRLLIKAELSE